MFVSMTKVIDSGHRNWPRALPRGKQRNSGPAWINSLTSDLLPDGRFGLFLTGHYSRFCLSFSSRAVVGEISPPEMEGEKR